MSSFISTPSSIIYTKKRRSVNTIRLNFQLSNRLRSLKFIKNRIY